MKTSVLAYGLIAAMLPFSLLRAESLSDQIRRAADLNEIEWIEAADYYSCLHVSGKQLMLREPIKDLAETLDPAKFVRVHRSAIVNIGYVSEILREGRNEGWVLLTDGRRLKMSKTGWQALLAAGSRS
jgi:two-component system, LytTR family, response regulator